jgi:hypothetical protein
MNNMRRYLLPLKQREAIKERNHEIVGLQIVCDHQPTPDLEDDISVSSTKSSIDRDESSSENVRNELANFLNELAVRQEDDISDAVEEDDISTKSDESSLLGFNSLELRRTKGFKRARRGVSRRKLFDDIEVKAPSSVENEDGISDGVEEDDISTKSDESSLLGFNSLDLRRTKGFKRARRGVSRRKLFDDIEVKAPSSVENAINTNVGRLQSFNKNNLEVDLQAFLLSAVLLKRRPQE